MIEEDLVECVIGLGPNLFYNSPMEACLLITKTNKTPERKGKILIINAVKEVRQDKNMGYLDQTHIDKIFSAYEGFEDQEEFAKLVSTNDILANHANLAINLYVRPDALSEEGRISFGDSYANWEASSRDLKTSMEILFKEFSR